MNSTKYIEMKPTPIYDLCYEFKSNRRIGDPYLLVLTKASRSTHKNMALSEGAKTTRRNLNQGCEMVLSRLDQIKGISNQILQSKFLKWFQNDFILLLSYCSLSALRIPCFAGWDHLQVTFQRLKLRYLNEILILFVHCQHVT